MLRRLLVLFIAVPIVEMFLLLQMGQWFGSVPAVAIVVISGVIGAWLTKTQGLRVIGRFQAAMGQGRLPAAEVLEGVMILVAGALLLTPGFLTDAAGYLLLIPPVRAWAGRRLRDYLMRQLRVASPGGAQTATGAGGGADPARASRIKTSGPVVDAEIVDD